MMHDVWDILCIEATDDVRAIKRAYAKRLKETRPNEDPEGFQKLRWAYETAREYAEDAESAYSPVSQQPFEGVQSSGIDGYLDVSGTEPNSEREGVWGAAESENHTTNDAELENVDGEVDIGLWVDSVINAENPVQAFREVITSPELLPIRTARLFELAIASRFCEGMLSPYQNLPLFAEIATYYRWDDPRHHVIYHWYELEEPAMIAVGAHRCRNFLCAVAADEENVSWSSAQGLVGARDINFVTRRWILDWIPLLRASYGEGWYWLLPGDLTELNVRSEKLILIKEQRKESGFSVLGWGLGVVTGVVWIMLLLTLARHIYYLVKIGWIILRPTSPSESA